VSSVHRNDKYLVAVVLGETPNSARDARMRTLIEDCMRTASAPHTAPTISQVPGRAGAGAASTGPARGFAPASAGSRPVQGNFEE
jgi:D-alanyl-D-alanine carboxypeptidase